MRSIKIYILMICLVMVLAGCSLSLAKKVNMPATENIASSTLNESVSTGALATTAPDVILKK